MCCVGAGDAAKVWWLQWKVWELLRRCGAPVEGVMLLQRCGGNYVGVVQILLKMQVLYVTGEAENDGTDCSCNTGNASIRCKWLCCKF